MTERSFYPKSINTLADLKRVVAAAEAAGIPDSTRVMHDHRVGRPDDDEDDWFHPAVIAYYFADCDEDAFLTLGTTAGATGYHYLDVDDSVPIEQARVMRDASR